MKGNKTLPLVAKCTHVMIATGCPSRRKQIVYLSMLSRGLWMNKSGLTQLFK